MFTKDASQQETQFLIEGWSMQKRERGVAIIMVLLVLAALMAIGTPFIMSMMLHERSASQSLAKQKARLAATSARNHAVAQLMQSHPFIEADDEGLSKSVNTTQESSQGGSNSSSSDESGSLEIGAAKIDTRDEFEINFPGRLSIENNSSTAGASQEENQFFKMRDWKGQILSASVEDEQGKININTATPTMLGNLLGGSQLSGRVGHESSETEIPVVDTSPFYSDGDPDTVDGVVVVVNPLLFSAEAISYTGKTETHLTGCFRGQYFSIPQDHAKGWPVFDLRAFKTFLNRHYDIESGSIRTYRTPQSIREIAEWSIVPYFLENIAMLGLNKKNMKDWGLQPSMLIRAGFGDYLMERKEPEYDEDEYKEAVKKLKAIGVTQDMIDMLVNFRNKAAVIDAGKLINKFKNASTLVKTMGKDFEKRFKQELDKRKKITKKYFPKAINAYEWIHEESGLETYMAADFERIRDFITTTSAIDAEWSEEQAVIGEISSNNIVGFPSLQVANYSWFNPGTLIRIRSVKNPKKIEYHLAMGAYPNIGGPIGNVINGGIILKSPLKHDYEEREAVVSAMLRHPVNINTASRPVVEAVLSGISLLDSGANVRYFVSSKEAKALAKYLEDNRPILGFEDFSRLVTEASSSQILDSSRDIELILLNSINPNSNRLSVSTTGFCYSSGDVYTIDATGVINNPAGTEIASHHIREIVEVAPPSPLKWILDTQDDWMYRIFRRPANTERDFARNSIWMPAREGNKMVTEPRALHAAKYQAPATDQGFLRSEPMQSHEQGAYTISIDHFNDQIDGHNTADGPFEIALNDDNNVVQAPASVDFWVKPRWESYSTDHTFFDSGIVTPQAGDDPRTIDSRNRIRLFYDATPPGWLQNSSAGGAIVLQVMGGSEASSHSTTGISNRSRDPIAGGEIRYYVNDTTFSKDTWYHIQATWSSSKPGHQQLLIDGHVVGEHTWQTELAGQLSAKGGRITIADANVAARFPNQGVLEVGSEIIEYEKKKGRSFEIRNASVDFRGRGARGSVVQNHPKGTPVRLYGFSSYVLPSNPDQPLSLVGIDFEDLIVPVTDAQRRRIERDYPERIVVGKGGAKLQEPLYRTSFFDRIGPYAAHLVFQQGANAVPPIAEGATQFEVPGELASLGFPPRGYLQITGLGGRNQEYIFYTSMTTRSGNTVFSGLARGTLDTEAQAWPRQTQNGTQPGYFIVSSSIETDVTDLEDRYPASGILQLRYGAQVEWVRYARIMNNRFFVAPPFSNTQYRGWTGKRINPTAVVPNAINELFFSADTIPEVHPAGTPIEVVTRLSGPVAGKHDWVNIEDTNGESRLRSSLLQIDSAKELDGGTFVTFISPPEESHRAKNAPIMLKFPAGYLPTRTTNILSFGGLTAASGAKGVGPFDGFIDEIRLSKAADSKSNPEQVYSQQDDLALAAIPLDSSGRPVVSELSTATSPPDGIKQAYMVNTVAANEELSEILLLGKSKVTAEENGIIYERSNPKDFALGKQNALLTINNEALFYNYDKSKNVTGSQDAHAWIKNNNLYRNQEYDPLAEENPEIHYERRLRTEVVPRIELDLLPGAGADNIKDLPARNGFIELLAVSTSFLDEFPFLYVVPPGIDSEGINDVATMASSREYIYYERLQGTTLINCLRGQLGSTIRDYYVVDDSAPIDPNDTSGRERDFPFQLVFVRALPTSRLSVHKRGMLSTEKKALNFADKSLIPMPQIPVSRISSSISNETLQVDSAAEFRNSHGYLLVDDGNRDTADEIISYRAKQGNEFHRYRDEKTGGGIFRGRFGTPLSDNLRAGTAVVQLPVRFHDAYAPEVETPDLQYLQRSVYKPGAHWDRISWELHEEGNRRLDSEVRVVARLDGKPDWDTKPTNKVGGLYMFTDPDAANRIDEDADQIEFRIYFSYPKGSYGRNSSAAGGGWNDTWKHSPVLDKFTIEYRKEWRPIHREDLPF